ncbi:MAG: SDR family oxidoreductase [Bacteroidota bacterium]
MNLDLSGKNALVCGSSKGIGRAAAVELALLGASVTLVSRSAEKMSDIIQELDQAKGQRHDFLAADFTNSDDLKKKVKGLVTLKPIHILINNTGGPPGGPIIEAAPEEFIQAFHNHLICSHLLTQLVINGMKEAGYGRIVNIISTSVKEPIGGLGVSNTTRGAMGNWAKTMANELGGFGITVNNLLPGFTQTGRLEEIIDAKARKGNMSPEEVTARMKSNVPAGRFAHPREMGGVIAFLASPAAAYVNGTNVVVDGGRTKSW